MSDVSVEESKLNAPSKLSGTQKTEARDSQVQGLSGLQGEFSINLVNWMRPPTQGKIFKGVRDIAQ